MRSTACWVGGLAFQYSISNSIVFFARGNLVKVDALLTASVTCDRVERRKLPRLHHHFADAVAVATCHRAVADNRTNGQLAQGPLRTGLGPEKSSQKLSIAKLFHHC